MPSSSRDIGFLLGTMPAELKRSHECLTSVETSPITQNSQAFGAGYHYVEPRTQLTLKLKSSDHRRQGDPDTHKRMLEWVNKSDASINVPTISEITLRQLRQTKSLCLNTTIHLLAARTGTS